MVRTSYGSDRSAIRNAKPTGKQQKLFDSGGLFLLVTPAGGKRWVLKYRFDGKEKSLALGTYPAVPLVDARKRRDAAREKLAAGIDPGEARKEAKRAAKVAAANSFEAVAREWYESQRAGWTEVYAGKVLHLLEIDVFPQIGARPIGDIDAPHMLDIVRAVEARGVRETAKRILQRSRAVFQYGIMTGRCTRNPAADIDAQTVLKKGPGVQHMARVKATEIPQLMRDIDRYQGDIVTRLALRFMALTFVRTTEMIRAEWSEFDETAAEWRVPAERMKMRDPHIVPLSRQALDVLAQLRQVNGQHRYVFYSVQGRGPISNNTMLYALYRMGYKSRMTGHGFRGLAATALRELGYSRDVVERQMAHAERNQVTAAYVHAEYLPERRKMMQVWANHLDKLKAGATVLSLSSSAGNSPKLVARYFIDTEFTGFDNPELVSLAIVGTDGREFYAERSDFNRSGCSDFARAHVLPQLGGFPGRALSAEQLRAELRQWIAAMPTEPQPVMCCDGGSEFDLPLLYSALGGPLPRGWHTEEIAARLDTACLDSYRTAHGGEHHALYDARANAHAFREPDAEVIPITAAGGA